MSTTSYLIWRAENKFRYRVGREVHEIPWSLSRERELQKLMAEWDEYRPDREPGSEWADEMEKTDGE